MLLLGVAGSTCTLLFPFLSHPAPHQPPNPLPCFPCLTFAHPLSSLPRFLSPQPALPLRELSTVTLHIASPPPSQPPPALWPPGADPVSSRPFAHFRASHYRPIALPLYFRTVRRLLAEQARACVGCLDRAAASDCVCTRTTSGHGDRRRSILSPIRGEERLFDLCIQ